MHAGDSLLSLTLSVWFAFSQHAADEILHSAESSSVGLTFCYKAQTDVSIDLGHTVVGEELFSILQKKDYLG